MWRYKLQATSNEERARADRAEAVSAERQASIAPLKEQLIQVRSDKDTEISRLVADRIFLDCHEHAIEAFGGVPARLMIDNFTVGRVAAPRRCGPGVQRQVPGLLQALGLPNQPLQCARLQ